MREFIPKSLFDKIETKTNIKSEDIINVADSIKDANLQDEETVRLLVKQLSSLANVPVSQDKEDSIVDAIINQKRPLDFREIDGNM
ncbi:stage VI sporulation protein F [Bacillus sp. Marseille-P3661]|uniref:stage VI sporulation protein F n=1 Tax=Bacillus sp. Marseille-P3661 TaxID=1936234 RepID=UPI000C85D8CA|nr:stage VI sporulation protein F [Bacillus sp. Marseille-P3661]